MRRILLARVNSSIDVAPPLGLMYIASFLKQRAPDLVINKTVKKGILCGVFFMLGSPSESLLT